jgi:hypothetical protein
VQPYGGRRLGESIGLHTPTAYNNSKGAQPRA